MLHKSFKPAKCKTSLKLATSRIKLMKNKKGVQINQMKRDLAQLLETGQDRTARIRVEHVIREEKTIAAYDLIEIYCELIVARMPIIESQKTCPIDLKEAVTSVIFAAPRCSDISELADIKKQFTAKFGKEFVSAALELRPESGVSRMLVEKLSAVAPDIQTKVKVLTGVAKDHNINWEPTSFEEKESNPMNDLLVSQSFQVGPTEHASVANANANPGLTKIQPSNINHEKNTGPPLDFAQQNKKFVLDNNVVGTSSSSGFERKEEGQNWNMGFKDATSAAEAAAESAERAAMAARAAAQFASHEKIPGRDEKASHIRDSYERKPKINYQQMDQSEHEQKDNNTRSNKSNTFKESKPELQSGKKESFSGNRNPKVINQEMDRYEHEQKDTERFHEAKSKSSKLNSFVESKTELESGTKGSFESENVNFFAEEASRKQARDHDSSFGYEFNDEVVSDDKKVGKRTVVGNPFAVVDERNIFSESRKSKSDVVDQIDDEATFDDDYVDDDGGPKFDTGFEYDEFGESSTHSLENAHIWSPRKNESIKIEKTSSSQSHLFSENLSFGKHSVKSSETEDRVPASFDHSDSDNESEFTGNNNNFNDIPEPSITKSRIELNDLVEEERETSFHDRKNEEKKKRESEEKSYDRFEDNESLNPSNEVELNFGKLTGGLRHKAAVLKYPPYTKPLAKTDAMDSPNKSFNDSSMIVDEIIPDSKASKKTSVSKSNHESDLDDYSDKFQVPSSNPRSQFSPPTPFFDDDDDDDDEDNDVLKQTSSSVRLRSELSRRTRGSPSISRSKIHVNPNPKPVTSSSINSRYSYSDEITADPPSIVRKTEGNKKTTEAKIQMPVRKSEESGKTMENLGSVDNLVKKPSYVHPKLPDYDTFAARLQSLRDERK